MIQTTKQEKQKLKVSKSTFNSVKRNHPLLHKQLRDEVIRSLVKSNTPEWNSLGFNITKSGI